VDVNESKKGTNYGRT
jgi:hypothetical protein